MAKKINQELEKHIVDLASIANPTQEQIDVLLDGWSEYFERMDISVAHQKTEFSAILNARLASSAVSIAAPIDELSMITHG